MKYATFISALLLVFVVVISIHGKNPSNVSSPTHTQDVTHTATVDLSATALDKVPDMPTLSSYSTDSKALLWLNVYKFSMQHQGMTSQAVKAANEAVRNVYSAGITSKTDGLADLWWTTYKYSMNQQGIGSNAVLAANSAVRETR